MYNLFAPILALGINRPVQLVAFFASFCIYALAESHHYLRIASVLF